MSPWSCALVIAGVLFATGPAASAVLNRVSFQFQDATINGPRAGGVTADPPGSLATLSVDFDGTGLRGLGNGADPNDNPFGSPEVWASGKGTAFFGLLRASAVVQHGGGLFGTLSSVTASSTDEFVITTSDPALDGQFGQAQAKMVVTGSVRVVAETGSPQDLTTAARYGLSVAVGSGSSDRNLNQIFDTDTLGASRSVFANADQDIIGAARDSFNFRYGDVFTLRHALTASAGTDRRASDIVQRAEADLFATAYLGFILPPAAILTSVGSGQSYLQAVDEAVLDSRFPNLGGSTMAVPIPAGIVLLLTGLGVFGLIARRQAPSRTADAG